MVVVWNVSDQESRPVSDVAFLWPHARVERGSSSLRVTASPPDLPARQVWTAQDALALSDSGGPTYTFGSLGKRAPSTPAALLCALLLAKVAWIEAGSPDSPPHQFLLAEKRDSEKHRIEIPIGVFNEDEWPESYAHCLGSLSDGRSEFLNALFGNLALFDVSVWPPVRWKDSPQSVLLRFPFGRTTETRILKVRGDLLWPGNIVVLIQDAGKVVPLDNRDPHGVTAAALSVLQKDWAAHPGAARKPWALGAVFGSAHQARSLLDPHPAQPLTPEPELLPQCVVPWVPPVASWVGDLFLEKLKAVVGDLEKAEARSARLVLYGHEGASKRDLMRAAYALLTTRMGTRGFLGWLGGIGRNVPVDWEAYEPLSGEVSEQRRYSEDAWFDFAPLCRALRVEDVRKLRDTSFAERFRTTYSHRVFVVLGVPSLRILNNLMTHPLLDESIVLASVAETPARDKNVDTSTLEEDFCETSVEPVDETVLLSPSVRRLAQMLGALAVPLPPMASALIREAWDTAAESFGLRRPQLSGRESPRKVAELARNTSAAAALSLLRARGWLKDGSLGLSESAQRFIADQMDSTARLECLGVLLGMINRYGELSTYRWYDLAPFHRLPWLRETLEITLKAVCQVGGEVEPYQERILRMGNRLIWFYRQRDDFIEETYWRELLRARLVLQQPRSKLATHAVCWLNDEQAASLTAQAIALFPPAPHALSADSSQPDAKTREVLLKKALVMGHQAEQLLVENICRLDERRESEAPYLFLSAGMWLAALMVDIDWWTTEVQGDDSGARLNHADRKSREFFHLALLAIGEDREIPPFSRKKHGLLEFDQNFSFWSDTVDEQVLSRLTDVALSRRALTPPKLRDLVFYNLLTRIKVEAALARRYLEPTGELRRHSREAKEVIEQNLSEFRGHLYAAWGAMHLATRVARVGTHTYGDLDAAAARAFFAFHFYSATLPAGESARITYLGIRRALCQLSLRVTQLEGVRHSRLSHSVATREFVKRHAFLPTELNGGLIGEALNGR